MQPSNVTFLYNYARLLEDTMELADAEALYRRILKDEPTYVDCKWFDVSASADLTPPC
jgi:hypothetical protein